MKTKMLAVKWVLPVLFGSILAGGVFKACGDDTNNPMVNNAMSDLPGQPNLAELNARLIIKVSNLSNLVTQASQQHHEIILYLNGIALKGLYPESIDLLKNELRFQLQRTDSTRSAWAILLGQPDHLFRKIAVSVGLEDEYPIATYVQDSHCLDLVVIRKGWSIFCMLVLVLLAVWLWFWGRQSQMLRDPGPDPGGDELRPYSLAKTQMAFWFFLTVASFLVIWAITGAHDTVTDSVLMLVGIGTGTALGVAVQDKSKEGESELGKLKKQKSALTAQGANTTDIDKKIQEMAPRSEHFLTDILTDADGISFHRFQMVVWTLILGVIFIKEVYCNLAMPDFNSTLLALMGISSGTYLGFMINEGHSTEQSKPVENAGK